MSSSVFIENNLQAADNNEYASTSDSSLVVVYGKNGISFDDKGLENLIEEKKISSISVVRLTSPTPSMRDEEEETEKLEEMLRRQEILSDKESLNSDNEDNNSKKEESSENSDSSNGDDNEDKSINESEDSSEESKTRQRRLPRRRGRQSNAAKQKKTFRKRRAERPEIVGLRLEEFYPAEDANEIIKEALKIAGLKSDKKSRSEYEFQLLVIHNDHCYTPFTSPAQMKAKLSADRIEAEKQAANRKITVVQTSSGKQLFIRRKLQQNVQPKSDNAGKQNLSSTSLGKDNKGILVSQKPKKDIKDKPNSENIITDDSNIRISIDENEEDPEEDDGSDLYVSDGSAETDNDRDSDLDFDVNNPKGRKRKVKLMKIQKRTSNVSKVNPKPRRSGNQDESIELPSKPIVIAAPQPSPHSNIAQRQKPAAKIMPDPNRIIRSTPSKIVRMIGKTSVLSPVIAALPPIPKKQNENKSLINASGNPTPTSTIPSLQPKTIFLVKGTKENKTSPPTPPQTHKEIVINKQFMSSPKANKGFTDLTKLIEQTEKPSPVKVYGLPTTPKSTHTATITSVVTFSPRSTAAGPLKGFMPLETAVKSQLPAQISIQTHQSSSELEAEHDKQLDLINSIVQDELQKVNEKTDEQISNINENIPELVKMLESTEKVLESSKVQHARSGVDNENDNNIVTSNQNIIEMPPASTSSANNLVGEIDITSASLLATPEEDGNEPDDLPDDILQQVVDLIKDDKTLQEAVEKQVFGTDVCGDGEISNNIMANHNPPPLAPISQQPITIQENPQTPSKSIIQLAISNDPTPLPSPSPSTVLNPVITTHTTITTPTAATTPTLTGQVSKASPIARKEPIQIVRGNGRVITLPPIEAPTTRAKRRAQAQPNPNTSGNTSFIANATMNESSLDSSINSNSSMTMGSSNSVATVPEKKTTEASSRRRGSKENLTTATVTNQKAVKTQKAVNKKGGNKSNASKGKVETEATASEEDDDDDPNKLWCICRQPHNNRFMICCDVCEDWFHGTCVSITKAMGLEMEQKGIDWTCPKCSKKQEEKKQPKITEMLIRKPSENVSAQNDPVVASTTLAPAVVTTVPEPKPVIPTNATGNIEIINITPKKETTAQNLDIQPHLKLQSGQIINLKDFNTTSKRATIIQTSTSSTTPLTAGQKKLFVTSGQGNLKLTSQPGAPIRTFTVVKQLTTAPQQHHNQNIKIIKTFSSASSTVSHQAINICTTSTASSPIISVSSSTSIPSSSIAVASNESTTLCIVCKKMARCNSIYCSDDCIRKHAQNALNSLMNKSQTDASGISTPSNKSVTEDKLKKKSKGLFEELLSAADRKPKVERVNVYERKSGRVITGNSAPTAANLKKWLQDNPTFEVIQPGSMQAIDLEKKHKLRAQQSSSPITLKIAASSPPPLKMFSSTTNSVIINKIDSSVASSPSHSHSPQMQIKAHKNIIDYLKPSQSHPASPRPSTPKQLPKYPQHVIIKPDKTPKTPEESKTTTKEKPFSAKRQTSTESSGKSSNNDGEPIRLVVRRTLKEQLLLRIKEESTSPMSMEQTEQISKLNNVPKLTEEEVEEFAKITELEMYTYFNKDTGTKYKAKYRSLVFNIKDRKNHTLFAKICGKLIEPKQLVRMSPEELASQELAQWREQENKHQLEMIKKSELDLLSCAKNYFLKTHKGEEVIEGKSSDYASVDITIPVEDVVSAINKSDLPDTSGVIRKDSQSHWSDADSTFLSHSHSLVLDTSHSLIEDDKSKTGSGQKDKERDKERDREKDRSRGRDREKERERDKRRKSKDRHHEKTRSRKRSRSHSRSRSRERTEKRHKSSHKEEKRDREERNRADKERTKDRSDREHSDAGERKTSSEVKKGNVTPSKPPSKRVHEQQKSTINPLETYNLIDQILESTKTVEEAANLISDKDKEKEGETQRKSSVTPQPVQAATSTVSACSSSSADAAIPVDIPNSSSTIESDQEPTSTVSIPTPPHDPYSRFIACSSPSSFSGDLQYTIVSLWTGNINMVDVASFQLSIQPIVGNSTSLAKLLPKELDVVGRIGPETVWDYISKIKKSPNKEIVVIRLIPATESETVAYKILYEYLDNRSRLGVIKSINSQIKDFYIYPLGAGKNVPTLLQPSKPVEFYDDPIRPDVLIGIIVRVVGSKRSVSSSQSLLGSASTSSAVNKHSRSAVETDHFTPPGSPKPKRHRQSVNAHKVGAIDIDAIIKAPIVAKAKKKMVAAPVSKSQGDDADEPYSPGGSSDEDMPLLPVKMLSSSDQMQTSEDELKRKMEEINRQIAAQEMEIAGLLTGEPTTFGSASAASSNVLANISIPSNLSQILASIKTTGKESSAVAPPPPLIGSLLNPLAPMTTKMVDAGQPCNRESSMGADTASGSKANSTSLLAKLSEAELLKMVPDDIVIAPSKPTRFEEPPPPGV